MTLGRFLLAPLDSDVRDSVAHVLPWANQVLCQSLVEGNLSSRVGETTAMDLPQQDDLGHWEVTSSPLQLLEL